ncbi:unnamed protein product [Linum tenue]|uniref:non-specific serine/threonine protein kinase n=1 Tax=Linum tenue TaxID=586396 RepID=A0AAV0PC74_9ROSI|nr:unnamed protein product [Linum tenue]
MMKTCVTRFQIMAGRRLLHPPFLFFFLFFSLFRATTSNDTVNATQPLKDGDVLVSETGKFAVGFFSPGRSTNRYLGIWFHEVPEITVVWVANGNNPIAAGDSGILSIDSTGNLVLLAGGEQNQNQTRTQVPIWSTNVSANLVFNSPRSARILDSGNFALFSSSNSTILWQSFDYPTNTFLPGAKLGLDRESGLDRFLTSWRSEDDPGTGEFSFRVNPKGSPQFFLYKDGKPYTRSLPWPWGSYGDIFNISFVNNREEGAIFQITLNDDSLLFWEVLDTKGILREKIWRKGYDGWKEYWATPTQKCDTYRRCGGNGLCDPSNDNTFECSCLPGYEPRSPRSWRLFDGSGGCVRKPSKLGSKLELELGTSDGFCGAGEGFVRVPKVKVPDSSRAVWIGKEDGWELSCERECRKNCSCSAYTEIDAALKGKGCLLWYGELVDTVYFPASSQDLYVRVDAEEFANYQGGLNDSLELKLKLSILLPSIGSAWLLVIVFAFFWLRKWRSRSDDTLVCLRTVKKRRIRNLFHPDNGSNHFNDSVVGEEMEGHSVYPELPFFNVNAIRAATNNFSPANTLGRGGFGSVHKGRLPNGQEVAVKRLSKNSRQGLEQFRNEVLLIAKLQHRNLVKLHGCCIEDEEQMLIYEYLPNRSLDLFLFDRTGCRVLDWTRRFNIIVGIARGILYLHQDSRFRIIHRDLKTSNILLDGDLNPKISDFGMAKILEADKVYGKTAGIGGTYGYMSPEYAVFGKFSEKSDVFSFGVILLETITGKRINRIYSEDDNLNLITYVWEHWKEDKGLEVVDSSMEGSFNAQEVLKCIHIGLLCVEEDFRDRPNMSTTVLMLNTAMPLPRPKQPGFHGTSCFNKSRAAEGSCSVNEFITIDHHGRNSRQSNFLIMGGKIILLPPFIFFFLFRAAAGNDTVTSTQPLRDGDVLVSETGKFALGFFSPGRSSNRYLGIWFYQVPRQSVVWVANRNNPIAAGDSGILSIDDATGNLVLHERNKIPIWSTNVSAKLDSLPFARILDSGNFALFSNQNSTVVLWQSVDYPTNTYLPGAKLGLDRKLGLERFITSWRSEDDPGTGQFSFRVNPKGSPQVFHYRGEGRKTPYARSFPWPWKSFTDIFNGSFINNEDEVSFSIFLTEEDSFLFWVAIDPAGILREKIWRKGYDDWKEYWATPTQKCDSYGRCGPNGVCDPSNGNAYECSCLPGYEPSSPRSWRLFDGSGGCVRKRLRNSDGFCGLGEGFVRMLKVKVPDTSGAVWIDRRGGGSEVSCGRECRKNCSCSAYAEMDGAGDESVCMLWYGDLVDTVYFPVTSQDLYVRVDAVEFAHYQAGVIDTAELRLKLSIVLPSVASTWTAKRRRIRNLFHPNDGSSRSTVHVMTEETDGSSAYPELPFFSFSTIRAATNNFSSANKVGQGGFGVVFKGRLPSGQDIAVKRLSEKSSQGQEQFRNEVLLIAKLQHRNLVKLYGCCIEEEEHILVYEYLPNKSLNRFLFDRKQGATLDWRTRFDIIIGIARGILYLHQDSRFRIIHRDLKTSNILLDEELNPKISDFGLAMVLEADRCHGKAANIGGTIGYMSPEYAVQGVYSEKSDVFSFGVIVIEMVTGMKITRRFEGDENMSLIAHVWTLWKEDRAMEVVDSSMVGGMHNAEEVLRCIQIGLLCMEENVEDRPNMMTVVIMLNSAMPLPRPKQPAFAGGSSCLNHQPAGGTHASCSVNDLTLTGVMIR